MTGTARDERRDELLQLGDSLASVADALLDRGVGLEEAAAVFQARYVKTAVARHGGNLSQAAAALGIHRNTLRAKLHRNGARPARGG